MKIILLENVKGIGKRHDIKDVPDGYAQNFLIRKKLAEPATTTAVNRVLSEKEKIKIEKETEFATLKKDLAEISKKIVTINAKANEKDHLFSSIHEKDIADAMQKEHQITVDPKYIVLKEPIKMLGETQVPVRIQNMEGVFTLRIIRV